MFFSNLKKIWQVVKNAVLYASHTWVRFKSLFAFSYITVYLVAVWQLRSYLIHVHGSPNQWNNPGPLARLQGRAATAQSNDHPFFLLPDAWSLTILRGFSRIRVLHPSAWTSKSIRRARWKALIQYTDTWCCLLAFKRWRTTNVKRSFNYIHRW